MRSSSSTLPAEPGRVAAGLSAMPSGARRLLDGLDLAVARPVAELHTVSHDPSLKHLVTLASGRTVTAVQLQMEYCEQARKFVEDRYGADADPDTLEVLDRETVYGR